MFRILNFEEKLREAAKKSSSLNGRAIKLEGWGEGLGINGPAIKRRTFFAASLEFIKNYNKRHCASNKIWKICEKGAEGRMERRTVE